jgi:hypothetical protein
MENETLVVLEEGTETTLEGPLACCLATMMDLI